MRNKAVTSPNCPYENHLVIVCPIRPQAQSKSHKTRLLIIHVFLGETSFCPRWVIVLLRSVGGGTNHCYDTYRDSHASQRPTPCISPPLLSQINGAVMSTSTQLYQISSCTFAYIVHVVLTFWQIRTFLCLVELSLLFNLTDSARRWKKKTSDCNLKGIVVSTFASPGLG